MGFRPLRIKSQEMISYSYQFFGGARGLKAISKPYELLRAYPAIVLV